MAPTVPREGRPQPFQLESHMAAYTAYAVYAAYIAQIGRPPCHFFSQRAQGIPRKSPAYLNSSEIYQIAFKSSGYANMRPPQACKAKSQQPSRNPRFALDPLLFAYQGIQWNSIGFLGILSPLQQPRKYRRIRRNSMGFHDFADGKGGACRFPRPFQRIPSFFQNL